MRKPAISRLRLREAVIIWVMKVFGFAAIGAVSLSFACAAETLEDFRWKKRLLVMTESIPELSAKLETAKEGLAERDVEVFVLRGAPGPWKTPDPALSKALAERLKLDGKRAEIVLLGKDGRTSLRWSPEGFGVDLLFRQIDAMPMRQKEMK